MATVTSLYICISSIYTYFYNLNSLSFYIPIACQTFSITCSISLAYPLLILFLYSYFEYFTYSYTYHVSSLCLFHLSALCLLLHSLYYYVYHIIPYLSQILCLFLVTCLHRILDLFHLISCIMFFASFLCFHVSYTFI